MNHVVISVLGVMRLPISADSVKVFRVKIFEIGDYIIILLNDFALKLKLFSVTR